MQLGTLGLDDEHLELHATARRWAEAHVDPVATKAMLDEALPAEPVRPPSWDDLAALGWLGLHVDEAHGGQGYGLVELAVVLEELGRACAPGPFLPTVAASAAIQALGADEQRSAWLPGLVDGSTTGAVARRATADVTATSDGDGFVLTGRAEAVLGGALADLVVVPAGDHWCVVRRGDPGVQLVARPSVDGTRPVADVVLDAAPIASTAVLRGETSGANSAAIDSVDQLLVVLAAAEAAGAMAWSVGTAAAYAAVREQFGRPIGQFQAVKHRCAGMLLRLERSRALAWDAARAADEATSTDEASNDASTEAVAQATQTALVVAAVVADDGLEVAKDGIQVLGGIGYTWDHDAHLYAKRALSVHQWLGGGSDWRGRLVDGGPSAITRRSLSLSLPPEAEAHRAEVEAFVADVQARPKPEWNAAVADAGYLVPHWPAPWGRDAGAVEQLVIDQVFTAARLRRPHLQVAAWVLPTIIAHGTVEQQERFVPPSLRGDEVWCQLFSEPGAGSDLASLATRAERDDAAGGWRLTGQKVWTTLAHVAQWGLCLARTDPEAPKHEGITAFAVDMATAGIEIRPLRELTGAAMFNEVFFDEVLVPDDCVIGPIGGGWEAARTTLANERVSMGSGSSFGPGLEVVLGMAGDRLTTDAVLADRLGALVAEAQAVAVLGLRSILRALHGAEPGAESSVRKLLGVEHEQAVQEAGLALLGPRAAAADGDAAAWVSGFLGNRALSIAGGTSDIQRNVIAERLLDLPKDP